MKNITKKARYINKKGKSKKIKPLKLKKTYKWKKLVHESEFHKYYNSKWNYGDRFIRNRQTYRWFYRKK